MPQSVLFERVATMSGHVIGVATLNMERALNALNMEMVELLISQLNDWKEDKAVVCVLLQGAGDKAFCAGGDVRAIHQAANLTPGEITDAAVDFFAQEYRLDYLLHTFGKPVLVWGDGVVMGGGLGLMAAASHRVVTERSRIAMPEVTIGLYPDVAGSYFLNRMPGNIGLFLGMTAYNLSASDALFVRLGNHYLTSNGLSKLIDTMKLAPWGPQLEHNHQQLDKLLAELEQQVEIPLASSQLMAGQQQIEQLMMGTVAEVIARMQQADTQQPWLRRAIDTCLAGSPISWHIIKAQAQLGTSLTLAQVFKLELAMSVNCCAFADFKEGVRALLIDKDRTPQWLYQTVEAVPTTLIDRIMTSPWAEAQHPLCTLFESEKSKID